MSELKATPGPWWIEPETGDVVAKDGDWEICTFSRSDESQEADANLISVANKLYYALEETNRHLIGELGINHPLVKANRELLAEARGEK